MKTALVSTAYPGASAEEVELEVTDRIEMALQEMPQLDYVESLSRAGLSIVTAEIEPSYDSAQLPQIWDELRKRMRDVQGSLPPGVSAPVVADDFGDVYGVEHLHASPHLKLARTDWRQRVKIVVADYDQQRARWSS